MRKGYDIVEHAKRIQKEIDEINEKIKVYNNENHGLIFDILWTSGRNLEKNIEKKENLDKMIEKQSQLPVVGDCLNQFYFVAAIDDDNYILVDRHLEVLKIHKSEIKKYKFNGERKDIKCSCKIEFLFTSVDENLDLKAYPFNRIKINNDIKSLAIICNPTPFGLMVDAYFEDEIDEIKNIDLVIEVDSVYSKEHRIIAFTKYSDGNLEFNRNYSKGVPRVFFNDKPGTRFVNILDKTKLKNSLQNTEL